MGWPAGTEGSLSLGFPILLRIFSVEGKAVSCVESVSACGESEREFAFVFHVEHSYPAATPRGFTLLRMKSMMESIGVPG